jgi:transposase-like protein
MGRIARCSRGMRPISYARHQFPPEIIRHAIWLYLRVGLRKAMSKNPSS